MLRHAMKFKANAPRFRNLIRSSSQTITKAEISEERASDVSTFNVGQKVHGFEVKDVQSVQEFNMTAIKLLHLKTKAEYLHLYKNDGNNVFSINFRTTPKDSSGLPHILEHTVLCGSQLYPVRDPFFKMLNRSLATFMNAMTAPDYTMYPFSTQNFQDFSNLQKIYLDAVFRPNLRHMDFLQEGWRLENSDPSDIKSELTIKGIVYNEMKGAFSENQRILEQRVQNLVLPDHTYGVISGGHPLKIPSLTWEDLKQFHRQYYHPSNARFYSYGNFPLTPTLKYLDGEYLSKYDCQECDYTSVPAQERWGESRKDHVVGRFENMGEPFEKQNAITVSLAMTDITNVYDTFVVNFLAELLIKGPNSAFYKSMIEPNFSGGFTSCTGFDAQPRDSLFTIGLQGLQKQHFAKFVELFESTINGVVNGGFDEKHIESVLHRYELAIKHETSNFGLHLLFGLISTWNHGGNLKELLRVNALLSRLRDDIKNDPRFLQKAVEKHLKNNRHRLILSLSPDKEYESRQVGLEKEVIKSKTTGLTQENRQKIYETGLELLREQSAKQNIDVLPSLQIQDISNEIEHVPREKVRVGPVPTQINKVNSNGLTYFKGVINTSQLTPEQHMLLPLFCYVITKMGTKKMGYREFDNLMMSKTSGLNLSVHFAESLYQLHVYEPGIFLSSYCLDKNVESMWELWNEIFNSGDLKDVKRFETLVHLYMSNLTHGIVDNGHAYAMLAAAGLVSGAAYEKNLLTGLQHITYMKMLVKTKRYKSILAELSNIARQLFDKNNMRCALNLLDVNKSTALKSYERFVESLPGNTFGVPNETTFSTGKVWAPTDAVNCQHHVLTIPVHYCSKAILSAPYAEQDYARLRVLARLLSAKYLHPEIREKQGAYGAGARMSPDGVFTYYSYRDPRHLQTLDVFDNSFAWFEKELSRVTSQDVLEAKLGVFQAVDAPIPPSSKGMREFLYGITPDTLQRHRAEIMITTLEGLRTVAEKYLTKNSPSVTSKVILGPKSESLNTLERGNELWTVVENE